MISLFHKMPAQSKKLVTTQAILFTLWMFFFVLKGLPQLHSSLYLFPASIWFQGSFVLLVIALVLTVWRIRAFYTKTELLSLLLCILTPSALIFTYGYSQTSLYPNIFKFGLTLFYFSIGFVLLLKLMEKEFPKALTWHPRFVYSSVKNIPKKIFFVVFILNSIFLLAGLYNLGKFSAVDEALWLYGRIPRYFKNFIDGEWDKTDVSDKPGITVSLLTGPALIFADPNDFEPKKDIGVFSTPHPKMEQFFALFRLPILLFAFCFLFLIFFLTEKTFGLRTALLNQTFLATSPILIGMVKIINPDSLLWIFSILTLLSYLLFQKSRRFLFLVLTGILFGLALLTKYVGNIILVFFFLFAVLQYLFQTPEKEKLLSFWRFHLSSIGAIFLVALFTFFVFLPATWIEPSILLESTFFSQAFEKFAWLFLFLTAILLLEISVNKSRILTFLSPLIVRLRMPLFFVLLISFFGSILYVIIHVLFKLNQYDFPGLLSSPKTISAATGAFGILFSNFYVLIFSQHPLVLLALIGTLIALLAHIPGKGKTLSFEALSILFFISTILLYYLGSVLNGVASIIRYQVILYPTLLLIAAWGMSRMIEYLKPSQRDTAQWVLAGIITFAGIFTLLHTPFPGSYASRLLPSSLPLDVKDMGPGSYEAAAYLNSLPNAKNITIWTDKSGVCSFFVGTCLTGTSREMLANPYINYLVLSSTRESRVTAMTINAVRMYPEIIPLPSYYQRNDAVYTLEINDRDAHNIKVFALHPLNLDTEKDEQAFYERLEKETKERREAREVESEEE